MTEDKIKIWDDVERLHGQSAFNYSQRLEKKIYATIKIARLIELAYGGEVTNEEWESDKVIYYIQLYTDASYDVDRTSQAYYEFVAFHTEEQAKEFLSHPENVQLLDDYYYM